MKVSPDEFKVLAKYIYEVSGVVLEANKIYLVETRLGPLVEAYDCASYSEFYYKAKADATHKIRQQLINAITTQETLFFRDQAPFEVLQYKIIPDLIDSKMAGHQGVGKIPPVQDVTQGLRVLWG